MKERIGLLLFVLIGAYLMAPQKVTGIPAWARKEGVPCSYCHYRYNRLNQQGLDYYRRGFRLAAEPAGAKKELKADFGNYFSIQGRVDLNKADNKDYSTSFRVTLFGGGEVSSNFSFLGETTFNPPDKEEVADLFAGYTVGNGDKYVFLRGGQLLPFLTVDNPFETAADRDSAFPRDRHVGASAGYNYKKLWGEFVVTQPAAAADAPTRNKADVIGNGQYIFSDQGSSLGGYVWHGNFNVDENTTDPFRRYGVVGNFNELKKLLFAGGFSAGRGDSAAGGTTKTRAGFGQAEYLFSDKFTAFLHVVRADPNTRLSGNARTIYTGQLNYWPNDHVNLLGRFIAANQFAKTDKQFTLSVRFIY